VRAETRNSGLKQQVAFLRAMQKMREEMDRVWKDFFEKNPDEKEEDVRQWIEERLRKLTRLERSGEGSLTDYR
jgi:bacterioferritin (cytochrome b1)